MKEILKKLTKPWSKKDVKWRVGSVSKDKKKALPLAYIDARTVMERLDDVIGAENWQDRYEFHGDTVVCYLSIRINDEWITKSDGAGDSAVEKEKGAISDAFKRASVKWGMGRELYAIKCRWQPINDYKQLVGDSWAFVIPNAADDEPESKTVDVEPEYNTHATAIKGCKGKAAFIDYWNSAEAKTIRANILEHRPDLYAELSVIKDRLLADYKEAEEKLLSEFNAA